MAAALATVCGGMLAVNANNNHVEAIDATTSAAHAAEANNGQAAAKASAKTVVATNHLLNPQKKIVIKVGINKIAQENERIAAQKAAEAKAAAERAEAERIAQAKAAAAARAAQVAAQQAAAQRAKAAAAAAAQQAATTAATSAQATTTSTTTTTNQGTFKLSFYDPAAMGSNMGYGGVAANLSVFPRGTRLKITLSNGTVWYRTVNDTGGFAAANPHQLDVAMPNSQIPAAGVLYATVAVVG